MKLSIVVPIYNEGSGILEFFQELKLNVGLIEDTSIQIEYVLVDNQSTDNSWDLIEDLVGQNPSIDIKAIQHPFNLGMQESLITGIKAATGDAMLVIQSDLQDPPSLIPKMVSAWMSGANFVATRIERRDDPLIVRIGSWIFYRVLDFLSGSKVVKDSSDFYLISAKLRDQALHKVATKPFVRTLISGIQAPDQILRYNRRIRSKGNSSYNHRGRAKFAVDAYLSNLSGLASKLAIFAISIFALSFLSVVVVIVAYLLGHRSQVQGWGSQVALIAFFGSINLLLIATTLEIVSRIYSSVPRRNDLLPLKIITSIDR